MASTIGDGMTAVALAGGIVGYLYMKHRARLKRLDIIHQERLAAMEKGIPLPEFPLEPPPQPRPGHKMVVPILGMVLLTLSLGAMIVLYLNLPPANHSFWIAPLPFAFLGAGFLAFHLLSADSRR